MTQKERLQALAELRNPTLGLIKSIQMLKGEKGDQGEQGEPGYTPVKGYDYFTDDEIKAIIAYIQSGVSDGKDGKDGQDGKNGRTPTRYIDYWTSEDQDKIVSEVLSKVPKAKDGVSPKIEDVVKLVLKEIKMPETKGFITETKLAEFLRRGGFRGGGDTVAAGSGISIAINANGQKEISATGSGSFTLLSVVTGAVDDTNTVFTFASAPSMVVINGSTYRNGSTAMGGTISIVGTTVTLPNPVGTGGDVYAIA